MRIILLPILVCFFVGHTTDLLAQNKKIRKKSVTEKSDIIVFDDEKDVNSSKSRYPFLIKTNPVSFVFGNQILEGEVELTDFLSLQIGGGVTFNNTAEKTEFYTSLFENESKNYYELSTNWDNDIIDYFNENRIAKLGYVLTASPKIFYDNDGFEGGYFAPTFTYYRLNFLAQGINNNGARLEEYTDAEYVTNLDLTVRYGLNFFYEKLMSEAFVGLGIRNSSSHRQDLGFQRNTIKATFVDFKESSLRIEMGFRIGLQL